MLDLTTYLVTKESSVWGNVDTVSLYASAGETLVETLGHLMGNSFFRWTRWVWWAEEFYMLYEINNAGAKDKTVAYLITSLSAVLSSLGIWYEFFGKTVEVAVDVKNSVDNGGGVIVDNYYESYY